jgi:hypothetical protein
LTLRRKPVAAAVLAAAVTAGLIATAARGDGFNPVRMHISVAQVARLHRPLQVKVHVSADPETLNDGGGRVRIQVKLARRCGGTYRYTSGVVLLNKALQPQPGTGSYSATARGAGKPTSYGTKTVCAFLDNDYQQFANDTNDPPHVDVSRACTTAAARYDADRRARRGHTRVAADRRRARRACGPGVPL